MSSNENIKAMMIFEVIGKPPEHLIETLETLIKNIDGEKGVEVVSKKLGEPSLMKDQKDFYTNFAEIEVHVEKLFELVMIMFKYMPAHIDVLGPEKISMSNNDWNHILNELTRRLHGYDEIARVLMAEKAAMQKEAEKEK